MFANIGRRWVVLGSLVVVAGLLFGCGAAASGGSAGGSEVARLGLFSSGETPYTISVTGSGLASASPDIADINLGVDSSGTSASEVIAENTTQMNKVLEAIRALGIADEDIQTVSYNMWVEQVYNPENGLPTGEIRYHINNQLRIRLRDLTQTGKLLEDALGAGANTVNGIAFSIENPTALQAKARELAIASARAKAESLAAGLGVKLGDVRQVSEYSSGAVPVASYAKAEGMGGGDLSISTGSTAITVDVQIVFDIAR